MRQDVFTAESCLKLFRLSLLNFGLNLLLGEFILYSPFSHMRRCLGGGRRIGLSDNHSRLTILSLCLFELVVSLFGFKAL